MTIDYRQKVSVPIRDMERDGQVAFVVDVYGVTKSDLAQIAMSEKAAEMCIDSKPMRKAVKRLRLDPNRYQAVIWDLV